MAITWFKLDHDLPNDIKLRRFSINEKWAWVVLLCIASKSSPRGIINADDEDISDFCEFSTTQDWLYFRDKLITKGMAEIREDGNLHILHWEDRQYAKPSDRPDAVRERVRRSREKKKESRSNASETRCNALQTPVKRDCNATDIDIDLDLDISPTYSLESGRGEKVSDDTFSAPLQKGDSFEQNAAAKNAQIFLMGLDGNTWNEKALKVWAKSWEDSGRNPGNGCINLKRFIRKRIHPKAEDHQSFLDEYQAVRAAMDKSQRPPATPPPLMNVPETGTPEYEEELQRRRMARISGQVS